MSTSRRSILTLALDAAPAATAATTLVCVYLRGGADGLALVAPAADPDYRRLRPTLSVGDPDDTTVAASERATWLDDGFAWHPSLAALRPAWDARELAIVHAVGSDDQTRSHFEAQDRMEDAGSTDRLEGSGWLARHLSVTTRASGLPVVAVGTKAPMSLRGAPGVAVLERAADVRLVGGPAHAEALGALYGADPWAPLRDAGAATLDTVDRLAAVEPPSLGEHDYPEAPLGHGLQQIAALIHAEVGVRVATCDMDGWDTHFFQDRDLPDLGRTLAESLAAFRRDLGDKAASTIVVVMTEFGRRAYENSSLGTDHGRAGMMLVWGGTVAGGRVVTDWPGLGPEALEEPGDLPVTIDYRDILAEVVARGLGNRRLGEVFPGYTPVPRSVLRG